VRLFCLAALPALKARQSGREPGVEAGEFGDFEQELSRFVRTDMARAGLETARHELARLAGDLEEALDLGRQRSSSMSTRSAERLSDSASPL